MVKKHNRREFVKLGGLTAFSLITPRLSASKPDVLIIGAGATGCNAAYHLREMGLSVTILEASPRPVQQASQAAAGFVANWSGMHVERWGADHLKMQQYGIDFYTKLASQTKNDIGFKKCGISYVYTKQEAWKNALAKISRGINLGVPLETLTKERAAKVLPLINFDQIAGAVFDATSVRVRASDTIPFLAQQVKEKGVEFIFNTRVESFIHSGSRVIGVKTAKGNFEAGNILITAGAWSLGLLNKEGVKPPVRPLITARFTTKPIPEVPSNFPMLIWSDIGFYIREEYGGLLIGGGENQNSPDRHVDPLNPPTSDNLNLGQIEKIHKHLSVIKEAMPVLKGVKIDEIRAGIPTFTTDVNFIADRVENIPNLYVITACQEAGITHGPALGMMIAELITKDKTTIDRSAFRLNRF